MTTNNNLKTFKKKGSNIIIPLLWVALFSFVAGVLYRMGGKGKPYNTKCRDLGVPAVLSIVSFILFGISLWLAVAYVVQFGLLFASLTTYNKWASRIFGYTDDNVHLPSWLVTGLFYGLASLPLAIVTGLWWQFAARCVLASGIVAFVSERYDNAVAEEFLRGFAIIVTMAIFLCR